ncbi:MAG: methyltransferase domain-containing protein [Chloroflexi bacterium]|nr:MAG: methyltransferase domain-containing protein [Chloroflexota bacterium]
MRMSAEDRVRWDDIYRKRLNEPYPPPNPLLFEYTPPVSNNEVKRALDVAAGFGQNGLWLASQGYHTDIIDISRVALERARVEMAVRNLRNINLLQMDLDHPKFEASYYDVICVFRFLNRELLPRLQDATVAGGRIIYETFNRRALKQRPDMNPAYLLDIGELKSYFEHWKILYYSEDDHITQLVALKPF